MIHYVGVPITRFDLVKTQVKSFYENFQLYKRATHDSVKMYYFSDVVDVETETTLCEAVKDAENSIGLKSDFSVRFVSKQQQKEFCKNVIQDFFIERTSKKFGGIREIHNIMSFMLKRIAAKQDNISECLIHKIDDDIFPLFFRLINGKATLKNDYSFFNDRVNILENPKVMLVGAAYGGDSCSVIEDTRRSIEVIEKFFTVAKYKKPEESWFAEAEHVCETSCTEIDDPYNLIQDKILRKNFSYADTLVKIAMLSEGIKYGSGHMVYAPSDYFDASNWCGYRECLSYGAISSRAKDTLYPTVNRGINDLITTLIQSSFDGGVYGTRAVFHAKNFEGRTNALDTKNIEQKFGYIDSIKMIEYIKNRCSGIDFGQNKTITTDFLERMRQTLDTIRLKTDSFYKLCKKSYWFSSDKYATWTNKIKEQVCLIDDFEQCFRNKILNQSIKPDCTLDNYMKAYFDNYNLWKKINEN